jgi:hypothetical protein
MTVWKAVSMLLVVAPLLGCMPANEAEMEEQVEAPVEVEDGDEMSEYPVLDAESPELDVDVSEGDVGAPEGDPYVWEDAARVEADVFEMDESGFDTGGYTGGTGGGGGGGNG